MLKKIILGDELLSDSFPYKEIENGMLWEVEGKVRDLFIFTSLLFLSPITCISHTFVMQWVVQGAVNVDIGANPSAEGCEEDEGVDDQAVKVVDIVDTFRLQVSFSIHDLL